MGTYQGTSKIRAKSERIKSQKLIIYVVLELPDKLPLMLWEKSQERKKKVKNMRKYEKSEKVKNEKSESWKLWWIRVWM